MFGIDSSELFVIGLVALLVIGPARLPHAMKTVGQWVAKGRAMTRHVRTGFDAMVREAELEEMQKAWAKHNEAIMKATGGAEAFLEPPAPAAQSLAQDVPVPLSVPVPAPVSVPESASVMVPPPADAAPEKPPRKRTPRAARKASDDA